jgi:hypothetical protein
MFDMFGHRGLMVCSIKGKSHLIVSQQGMYNRDPLGPALYSCIIHNSLVKIQGYCAQVYVFAYLDYIFICGLSDSCQQAIEDLQQSLSILVNVRSFSETHLFIGLLMFLSGFGESRLWVLPLELMNMSRLFSVRCSLRILLVQ